LSSELDEEAAEVPAALEAPGGSEVVLVVEDEEGVLKLVERILVKAGYRVLTARNGGEALLIRESRDQPIELLITDLIMPHLNGKELSDRMRIIDKHLKVLFISGYPERTIRERGIDLGIDRFLSKPFEPADLLQQVRFLLDA
jgi:DNA-binding response OmpR family regulator